MLINERGNTVKLVKQLMIAVMVLLPMSAMAQGKVAVISVQEAILNTQYAADEMKKLRGTSDYKKNRSSFEKLKKEGTKLVERLKRDADTMSQDEQMKYQRQITTKREDLELVGRRLQEAEKELAQNIMRKLGREAQTIITDLIKSENIGLLLDRQVALHVDSSFNITAKVTDKLNQVNVK